MSDLITAAAKNSDSAAPHHHFIRYSRRCFCEKLDQYTLTSHAVNGPSLTLDTKASLSFTKQ